MFTDIAGYSALMQADEAAAVKVRKKHRKVFDELHEKHNGKIIQYYGDGTLSTFRSAIEAVDCAVEIQRDLNSGQPVVPVRIGLHLGDIVFSDTEVYGNGVNVASRIESLGIPGAILVSEKINDELTNHSDIKTQSLGSFSLKNITDPVEIFAVVSNGLQIPVKDELRGKQSSKIKSVAVMPLVNLSSSDENEYFSDGMTEEIINALTRIHGLRVTSRTSSFYFKGKNMPVQEIAGKLSVSTILTGSVRLAGDQMRISVQLIDVAEDMHFWAETFDRSVTDVFAVQDEISLLIADQLREYVGHLDIKDHLVEVPSVTVDGYKEYLKARFHILKMDQVNIRKGIEILQRVSTTDPDFAWTYVGLNLGYTMLAAMGYESPMEAFTSAKNYLDKAIALDDNIPDVQIQLSHLAFLQDWDFQATYEHLQRSFEIRPTVDYYQAMASALCAENKLSAAKHYIDTAFQIDPFSEINYHLKGFTYYLQGNYDKALEFFGEGMRLKPDSTVSKLYYGQSLILLGRANESLRFFEEMHKETDELTRISGQALSLSALPNKQKAKKAISNLELAMETDSMGYALQLLILCQTLLGNHSVAMELMEKAKSYRMPLILYLFNEPLLEPLMKLPRFLEMREEIIGTATTSAPEKLSARKTHLAPGELIEYRKALRILMDEKQPHTIATLTLRELAEMLNISPNKLSELLNDGFNKNFAEFINSYRVETFKSKVSDPANKNLTILALAYESGFNSKTVFNTFFKKVTNQTPRQYWEAVHK